LNSRDKLKDILKKKFAKEKIEKLVDLLLIVAEKGKISYEEIKAIIKQPEEMLLIACSERILLPTATRTLAWEERTLTLKPGEEYEMPHITRNLILIASKTGEWMLEKAFENYLREIGEKEIKAFLKIFKRILNSKMVAERKVISPELIRAYSEELNLDSSKVIAILKGGGIISPKLRNPTRGLEYEINPLLIQLKI